MKALSKKTVIIIVIIAVAAAVAGGCVYLFMGRANYYETHFFQGTYINGYDASDLTAQDIIDDIQADIADYELTIEEKDGTSEIITGQQLGFTFTNAGEIESILDDQDGSEWFSHLSMTEDYDVDESYTYNESAIEDAVDSLKCFDEANIIASKDAYVTLQNEEFVIVPEVIGNELDKDGVYEAVKEAVSKEDESINLEDYGLYINPDVTSTSQTLINIKDSNNQIISAQITYDFVDSKWVVDKDKIISWLTYKDDGSCALDYDSVYQWVYNMAYETDTFGLSRAFMTSYGIEVELEGGGDYGWCIDKDLTAQHLYEYLLSGTVASIDPDYIFTAEDRSSNDIGGTYIEVCISTQTLWCYYEGALLVETPIISGCVALGYSTPSGSCWAIDAKKTDWTFTTFANSYCDYWIPYNGDCGIHDASWQSDSDYVVSTYLTAGSHGCLNTPYAAMQTIYNHVEIGMPVIIYYSTDQVHGPDPTEELAGGQ